MHFIISPMVDLIYEADSLLMAIHTLFSQASFLTFFKFGPSNLLSNQQRHLALSLSSHISFFESFSLHRELITRYTTYSCNHWRNISSHHCILGSILCLYCRSSSFSAFAYIANWHIHDVFHFLLTSSRKPLIRPFVLLDLKT